MASTPYKPVSWNGEFVTNAKLNQMTNNDQWLFENGARLRYSAYGLTRDAGLKVLSGITPHGVSDNNFVYLEVYFGSFFTSGCRPVVTATLMADGGQLHRAHVVIQGRAGLGNGIDTTGFTAIVTDEAVTSISRAGWVSWIAVGY